MNFLLEKALEVSTSIYLKKQREELVWCTMKIPTGRQLNLLTFSLRDFLFETSLSTRPFMFSYSFFARSRSRVSGKLAILHTSSSCENTVERRSFR